MTKTAALFLFAFLFVTVPVRGQNHAKFGDVVPGMTDEALQEQAVKIANQRAVDLRCPERYTKAVILSVKWHLELDNSGFVTGRKIHMELYCERPDGSCGMADFTFKQKRETDDTFSKKLIFVRNGNTYRVDCE